MKKILTLTIVALIFASAAPKASAQELKFGHVNLQEVIALMPEMDSAMVVLEKYSQEMQEIFGGMQSEFMKKYNDYNQMSANWAPSIVEAKTKELQEMEQNLQQFEANAQRDIQAKQQEMLAPIYVKAGDAIKKLGKAEGFIYIFDAGTGIPYISEEMSVDVTVPLKNALGIPLDKKLQAPQQGQATPAN